MKWLLTFVILGAAACAGDARETVERIGFDQNLNRSLPLVLKFSDEVGREVALKEFFGRRPVLLVLVYYSCPMLCGAELEGLSTCLRAMKSSVGTEFDVVTVSFDPADTPEVSAKKKARYLRGYHRPEAAQGWHFLTGSAASIEALTAAAGFRYARDPVSGQFMHASGMVLLTPEGKISKYYYGVEYYPRDLEFGLIEASQGRTGSLTDQALLYCYRYDPASGKYGFAISSLLKLGGVLTLLALGTFVVVARQRERRA